MAAEDTSEEAALYAERNSPHPALRATLSPLRGARDSRLWECEAADEGRHVRAFRATISATSSSRSITTSQSAKYERSSPIAIVKSGFIEERTV